MKTPKKRLKNALIMLGLVGSAKLEATTPTQGNATTPNQETVKTSSSGLKSRIITQAPTGAVCPTRGQRVSVHYTGWLEDKKAKDGKGKKFDSSLDRGKKFEFILGTNKVIKGWEEAVKDMKIGEKQEVIIPGYLAYGINGVPGTIPPNATLIFEIELSDAK